MLVVALSATVLDMEDITGQYMITNKYPIQVKYICKSSVWFLQLRTCKTLQIYWSYNQIRKFCQNLHWHRQLISHNNKSTDRLSDGYTDYLVTMVPVKWWNILRKEWTVGSCVGSTHLVLVCSGQYLPELIQGGATTEHVTRSLESIPWRVSTVLVAEGDLHNIMQVALTLWLMCMRYGVYVWDVGWVIIGSCVIFGLLFAFFFLMLFSLWVSLHFQNISFVPHP